jgi:hypothetical protein
MSVQVSPRKAAPTCKTSQSTIQCGGEVSPCPHCVHSLVYSLLGIKQGFRALRTIPSYLFGVVNQRVCNASTRTHPHHTTHVPYCKIIYSYPVFIIAKVREL